MVECLRNVKSIYEELYTINNKKVIKIMRQLAVILLKNEKHHEAIEELLQTHDAELKFYGEGSLQIART